MLRVAILGGTGRFGKGLARRLAAGGHTVVIGSRDAVRGAEAAAEIGTDVLGLSNADAAAARCDVVVMSVPPADAEATARELAEVLDGVCVVSVAANMVFADGRPSLISDGDPRSLAERIAEAAPGAKVAAAFHTVAASALGGPEPPPDDVLVCADDADAREACNRLVAATVTGRAIDSGPLSAARFVEPMTAAIVCINRRHKTHAGLRILGV